MANTPLGDLQELVEGVDFEAKKAAGLDGRGECPKSFFESYSAMANTEGGMILLGAEERDGRLRISGILDVARVTKQLWDSLNNRERLSVNLLTDRDVEVREVDGKNVILVRVPRAGRQQRPVHVGENPLKGTYVRNGEGDYLIRDEEAIRRMLAERVEDSRDSRSWRTTRWTMSMVNPWRATGTTSERGRPITYGTGTTIGSFCAASAAGGEIAKRVRAD